MPAPLFFRASKGGRRPIVAGLVVVDGLVTEAAPILRRYRGQRWHAVRRALEAAGYALEELEGADD